MLFLAPQFSTRTTTHFSQSNHDSKDSSDGLNPLADCCNNFDSDFEPDVNSEDDAQDLFESIGSLKSKEWAVIFKCKPLMHAQKLIHVLQSLDQHWTKFIKYIDNKKGTWLVPYKVWQRQIYLG